MPTGLVLVDGSRSSSSCSGGIDGVHGSDGVDVDHQFFDGEPRHDVKRALLTPGTATFDRLPLLGSEHLLREGVVVKPGAQELTAKTQGFRAVAAGQESEVADFDEAARQDMEKEAADVLADPTRLEAWLHQLPKKWVVYAKPPFGGPEQVLKYLARYTHRVAISNGRLVSLTEDRISFRWRDSKDGGTAAKVCKRGQGKERRLKAPE
jgi:hypothetical protein